MEVGIVLALVALFRAEQSNAGAVKQQDFMEWLERHDFKQLRKQIEGNSIALNAIESMLLENRDAFAARFDNIDRLLASILSGIKEFKDVSVALRPEAQVAEQAISILRQFLDSGGDALIVNTNWGATSLVFSRGNPHSVACQDPQFLRGDLSQLVEMRLLLPDGQNSDGAPIYRATREGYEYLKMIDRRL